MKKLGIYVFSGTGNTFLCAEILKNELIALGVDASLNRIEDGTETVSEENLIICYPVHGFGSPSNVITFCRNLPARRGFVYLLKTSGEPLHLNDNSSAQLLSVLRRKGYRFKGEFHYVMPYNMIFRHTDEMASKMLRTAKTRIPDAARKIAENEDCILAVPLRAKFFSGISRIEHWGVRLNGRCFRIKSEKCVLCMQCVNNCPMHNIHYQDGKFTFGKNCICCTRCCFHCPTDAFRIGLIDFMRVNGKYDFSRDPDQAVIGHYCRKAYERYFTEEEE